MHFSAYSIAVVTVATLLHIIGMLRVNEMNEYILAINH